MPRTLPRLGALAALCAALSLAAVRADSPAAPRVSGVPDDLRERLKLDPFYEKHLDLEGMPILTSGKVSDAALVEAAYLIQSMLAERPDVHKEMVKNRVRVVVMAPTEMTTDVPEQRHLKNDPKTDWDKRARGLGGRITSCGEENLLNLKGDRYRNENILIHEFAHAVHRYGLQSLDRGFDRRLKDTYTRAIDRGLWKGTYAATNHSEYWAEGVQSYFDCNNPPNASHNDVNTREKLEKYDPDLFALIDESFGRNPWRYVRYDRRAAAAAADAPKPLTAEALRGLPLRGIGPALTPGRVGDIAVNPKNKNIWYIAVASGGLWKTENRGISFRPIFDGHVSYSIGCVTLDPKNPDVVWLGTGENQSQRSVGYGDGVYKSTDGGKTWAHVGLKSSEHIAKILIDPRDSNTVYVASQGPLWAPGGDRGLYKTTDGGKSWKPVLQISENTGVTDVAMDPRDPDVLYAASYQRRRNVGVLIGGGPEAAIFKSTNGGESWDKLTKGLPEWDMGRIALAVSPQKPDVVYAHVQTAAKERGAFYRSENGGETWERRGTATVQDGQYYGEIYCDPHKFDRVYIMDINVQVTDDGGKTFTRQRWPGVHVDHHAIAFDPDDPDYLLLGNDGGLYESFDRGRSWRHFDTMPTPQFYRVAVDNAVPFYNVYGGTQDNGSMGGPSRSVNRVGVRTGEWNRVGGGDGMQPRVDPEDPTIVYTMSQNGAIVRVDMTAGTTTPIRPRAGKGESVRWHWDTPFIISPHAPKRLYLAGSRLYRSDDRGANWRAVSPDLTRQLDRNKIPVMGKVWGPGAVSAHTFTTALSVASALSESPAVEGLLYVGTDDGLVQVSEDGGKTWRKVETFPGVPEWTYVSDLFASHSDEDTVYAAFNDWQRGNFKPYLLRSTDRGKTWTSIAGDLPDEPVWSIVEDHVNKDLLFAGTEFGLYVTVDGGKHWAKLSGAPPIAFRDLEVQHREGDLVGATFGRGFFILDDYAALRNLTADERSAEGVLLPVRKTYAFAELPFARAGSEFAAPNPPPGALITYHLRDAIVGDRARVIVRVADADGKTIREVPGPSTAGVHRINWDLRSGGGAGAGGGGAGAGGGGGFGRGGMGGGGPMVKPGKYTLTLMKVVGGNATPIGDPQECEVVPLPAAGGRSDRAEQGEGGDEMLPGRVGSRAERDQPVAVAAHDE
jgi:photosystem II stability/assembly factor-like uncharacterized protein